MKTALTTSLMFVCSLLIGAGCSTVKHSKTSATATHDTLKVSFRDTVRHDSVRRESLVIRDTVISVPGATTTQTLSPTQLIPGTSYRKSSGHVHSTVTVDGAGNIAATCEADSLKLVVRALTERNTYLENNATHTTTASTDKSSHTAATSAEYYKKTKSWIAGNWHWIAVVLLVLIIGEIIHKARKRITNRPF